MELVAQQGLDNAQLLYAGKTVTTLTDGVPLSLGNTEPTVVRIFTFAPGLTCSIGEAPASSNAFTLETGENIWGITSAQQICVYGGDAEIMY